MKNSTLLSNDTETFFATNETKKTTTKKAATKKATTKKAPTKAVATKATTAIDPSAKHINQAFDFSAAGKGQQGLRSQYLATMIVVGLLKVGKNGSLMKGAKVATSKINNATNGANITKAWGITNDKANGVQEATAATTEKANKCLKTGKGYHTSIEALKALVIAMTAPKAKKFEYKGDALCQAFDIDLAYARKL
jgi:hypothetical protein